MSVENEIIALETAALTAWFNGDSSKYLALWSKDNFSYFDAVHEKRVDNYQAVKQFVQQNVDRKLFSDDWQMVEPRVQLSADTALLSYQLFANTSILYLNYNCVQLYQKTENGWKVTHSNWAFIRPMEKDFSAITTIV